MKRKKVTIEDLLIRDGRWSNSPYINNFPTLILTYYDGYVEVKDNGKNLRK